MAGGNGIFAKWQPVYAEAGLAAFPVDGISKKPLVSHYLKAGPRASERYASRFGDALALGIACNRSRLTVVDVDTTDETVWSDAIDRHGDTPIKIRSGSGHLQLWYRNGGETRKVRPDPEKPIDILGGGFVVAPPSQGAKGGYEFIDGSLSDLPSLPRILRPAVVEAANDPAALVGPAVVAVDGKRNETLFRECMRTARRCGNLQELLARASEVNATYAPPLSQDEVVAVAQKAWAYEEAGENRFGGEMVVGLTKSQFARVTDPFALMLIMTLRNRWRDGETFAVANAMADTLGWPRRKFVEARATLETLGLIVLVTRASKTRGAAQYRLG